MRHGKKPGRNTTWLFGRNKPPIESTARSIYFPPFGAGATVSACCCVGEAQAPSPKAVAKTATIMIIFRNFNLSRLLSSQVAPLRLGGESRRSNAFLHFFDRHKLAGRFVLRSRRCLRLWSLLPPFAAHKLPNPKAVRLLTNQ
jgi:hypothetical protein